ncbi:SigB/SigF/SigG family RNA polymerase sigma factor [Solirubrobacter soli]|uniref:SigB/SigF/SigG family RNA polymerase sigma factor n=1 Tax=Solirubrobacter soli TaxID=363832 RepID=UPI0003F6531E|nr:SigB/SigF/SigG family RNA polymerase sigma factor [Solirubrobacter soli]
MTSIATLEQPATDRRHDHDRLPREQLIERYLPLARHLARRYKGGSIELDDLNQVAAFALVKAVDRFDPDRGIAFSSFAVPTIVGELKRHFRDHGWAVRVPRDVQELKLKLDRMITALTGELGRTPTANELAERTDASIEQVLDALGAASAHYPDSLDRPVGEDGDGLGQLVGGEEPGYTEVENTELVDGLLSTLPERDREILRMRFEEELTQAEIGRRLGVSQMHISRLIRKSIARLQQASEGDPLTRM